MSLLRLPPHTRVMEEIQASPASARAPCKNQPNSCFTNAASKGVARPQEGSPTFLNARLIDHLQMDDDGASAMKMDGVFCTTSASMKMNEALISTSMRIDDVLNTSIKMDDEQSTPISQMNVDAMIHEELQPKWVHMHPQAIKCGHHIKSFSLPTKQEAFLQACFYCKRRLQPSRDIYMYRGNVAFCTEECRLQQILRDEERAQKGSGPSVPPENTKSSRKAVSAVAAA